MSFRTKAMTGATVATLGAGIIAAPFISTWEGREYTPYYDIGGVLTVCDGHTGDDIDPNRIYTDVECDNFLARDIAIAERAVNQTIKTEMPEHTKAAFISFTFNLGAGNLARSTLARKANSGDLLGACNELSRWVFVKGRRIRGLVNRRMSERAMCLTGLGKNPWWGV